MATRALPRRSAQREALPRHPGRPTPRKPEAPRLRVVPGARKAAGRRQSSLPVLLLVLFMVFGVAVLQAWVGQDGLHASTLEREVQREQERLTLLRARVAQLSSPHRLRAEAQKLGLVPAPDPVFLQAPVEPMDARSPRDPAKRLASPSP